MRTKKDEKFKLESVEELLGVVNEESAMDIEISKIQSFRAHPFKVLDDDKMQELIDSISVNGILTPVLVRPLGMDTYEMISGHRRMHDKIETVRKCDKRIIPLSELLEKYEGINICYEIDDIEKKLVEKQIEFIDISSLVQILELRKDIVLQAEMLFLRISTIYRGKFCIKRDYISLLEEKFPYMFLEKILFGKSSETKNEVNIEKKLDASEILRIAEDINNSLKGHDEFKIHFGKKVSYESITDELEKLIAYDNLRDIKRKVQDIVFCEFFKIR